LLISTLLSAIHLCEPGMYSNGPQSALTVPQAIHEASLGSDALGSS
jgi:hypothetical protein